MMQQRRFAAFTTLSMACVFLVSCGGGQPASAPAPTPEPPKPPTNAERAAWYQRCWNDFNGHDWAAFGPCYDQASTSDGGDPSMPQMKGREAIMKGTQDEIRSFPDMKGDVRLILANGSNMASVAVITGTNSGPLMGPGGKEMPPTNKKTGQWFGHAIETNADGTAVIHEYAFFDSGTNAAQLGLSKAPARPAMVAGNAAPAVVAASGSPTESKNVEDYRKGVENFNKHDIAAMTATLADDVVWHEAAMPADMDKKGMTQSVTEFWKGFSDARLNLTSVWAAGDYVVARGTVEGTNDGSVPSMGIKTKTGKQVTSPFLEIDHIQDGKLKEGWLFYDGGAFAKQLGM